EGYIRGVAASRHDDPTDARDIVARIEREPAIAEVDLDPGAEIHRIDDGHADVPQIPVDVAGRNVHAAAKRDGEVRVVAAHADAFLMGLERRSGRARVVIAKPDALVHEVADGLHAAPSWRYVLEQIPGDLTELVGLAVAASHQIHEAVVRQRRHRDFLSSGI